MVRLLERKREIKMSDILNNKYYKTNISKEFLNPIHNKVDYESYKDFQQEIYHKYSEKNKQIAILDKKKVLISWLESVPKRWENAQYSKLSPMIKTKISNIFKEYHVGSLYVYGDNKDLRVSIIYSIIRKFIENSKISPHEIKVISEDNLIGLIRKGFDGQKELEKIFDKKYKMYFLQDIGEREVYTDSQMDIIQRLINHCYDNNLIIYATSKNNIDDNYYNNYVLEKINDIFEGRVLSLSNNHRKTRNAFDDFNS